MFITALFTIAKTLKQPNCPSTEEWIKKIWYIYTVEYYSPIQRNRIVSFAEIWMDLEGIMQPERQILYDLTYIYLNVESKKQTKKPPQAQRYREETCDCWQGPQNR